MSASVCALSSCSPSHHLPIAHRSLPKTLTIIPTFISSRRSALISIAILLPSSFLASSSSHASLSDFVQLPASGGVKALDLRIGHGDLPIDGDQVISGIEAAVRSMRVGGVRRVIIPPSEGYQNTMQEPIPPNFFDRQRLFTTIFNPTRLANGEGSSLGTLVFDIELVSLNHPQQ
ncbi:peptidyl-prolyl cis-trans isomerase FKBP17-1, chloroplastic isoform X2 [Dioscorea cayenensis subsp. rotundata]|uniref:peptidylprolyl isomerase n=1 Tax=Dioscorea cayennensis subsp. rotundata TaxID=55577 RepID=A0AB40AHV6_DIOCR|nr:peptidyl-prolyl cis-trans isomerase FKBP17-1, chloroplastic isoform X2 [Dioscorea cayenensis subsp. rotundata]